MRLQPLKNHGKNMNLWMKNHRIRHLVGDSNGHRGFYFNNCGLFVFQQPIQIDLDTSRYSDTPDFLPIHLSTNRWEGLNIVTVRQCFFYKESFFMIIIVSITKCSNMNGSYQLSFFGLIQHMQKFQHALWLRTHQLTTNSAQSWNWELKVEIVTYWQVGWIFIVFCAVRMKRTATL